MSYNKNMLTHVFIMIFGAAIGSFLNVVILRYNSGESILRGGSRCFLCGKRLHWFELIPVLSFLIQKGKCRGCGSKISFQYPAVEFLTGLLFLLIYLKFPNNFLLVTYYWLLITFLIIIAVYDLRHKIIPNKIVWLFNALALLNLSTYAKPGFAFLSGVAFFSFFAILWLVSHGHWMGFGDVKLALGLGWMLGPIKTLSAFLISFWLGAVVGVALLILKKKKYTMKSAVPFAPFLIVGALAAFFWDINFFNIFYG